MSIFKSHFYKIFIALIITVSTVNIVYTQKYKRINFNAPNEEVSEKQGSLKNEVKLNLAFVPFGYFEAFYERLLPENSSLGIGFGKSIKEDLELNYHVILFYRLFFGEQLGKGFFIEANGVYWNEDYYDNNNNGIGLAVGGKFFRGKRFHGECVVGYGRTLTENSSDFQGSYPRFAISIGHRF